MTAALARLWARLTSNPGTCPETFSQFGPEYRCTHPASHHGRHRDQYGNTWARS